jgi:transcriptional regulator with XRE-family HTH domain
MKVPPKNALKQLGEIIRAKRKVLGYSQESFAPVCGVHRTYIGAIERGERNVALENLIKIASALDLKLSELLAEAGL